MNIPVEARTGYLKKPNAEAAAEVLENEGYTIRLAKKHEEINVFTVVAKKIIKIKDGAK